MRTSYRDYILQAVEQRRWLEEVSGLWTCSRCGGGDCSRERCRLEADQYGNNTYAAAAPGQVSVVVSPLSSTALWVPSTQAIYTGTLLTAGMLNATDSVAATIGYSIYLQSGLPSSATTVSVRTQLSAGSYTLVATITPTNSNYAAWKLSLPFTVQNMNIFFAGGDAMSSLYNSTTVPGPVYVTMEPLNVAGPLTRLYLTASPELALAESVAIAPGSTGDAGGGKLIVWLVVPAAAVAVPFSATAWVESLGSLLLLLKISEPAAVDGATGVKLTTAVQVPGASVPAAAVEEDKFRQAVEPLLNV